MSLIAVSAAIDSARLTIQADVPIARILAGMAPGLFELSWPAGQFNARELFRAWVDQVPLDTAAPIYWSATQVVDGVESGPAAAVERWYMVQKKQPPAAPGKPTPEKPAAPVIESVDLFMPLTDDDPDIDFEFVEVPKP